MRVAVIADIHLDTRFAKLGRAAALRRENLRKTLERAVALANEKGADALLVAGDLYEQERFSADTGRFLARVFESFSPRPVVIAPGNHDWWGPESLYALTPWGKNVHIFDASQPMPFQLEDGLWVWGAAHVASRTDKNFLEGLKVPSSGVHIGLFHGSEMSRLSNERADDSNKFAHAPFREADIERARLAHLFAGHYHRASQSPLCTYPGNPDPLTFGEDRDINPRGVVLAEIHQSGEVEVQAPHDVSVSRVLSVDVQIQEDSDKSQLLDAVIRCVDDTTGGRVDGSYIKISLVGRVRGDFDFDSLDVLIASQLDSAAAVVVDTEQLTRCADYADYLEEVSVRGEFVRAVLRSSELEESIKQKVISVGIAALEGRNDLLQ